MDWKELCQLWSIPEPWAVMLVPQGVNGLTEVIETLSGN